MQITLQQAAHFLNQGHVVGIPTETVYGLAASLKHLTAISRIFLLKGRPADNPLIIHLASADDIFSFVNDLPPGFAHLAAAFWPGPMTLVIPIHEEHVPDVVRAGLPTAAFRVPAHPLTGELLMQTGPLVMPSANLSGRPSSTSAAHVETDFGADFPVLDGGGCSHGLESTILHFHEGKWVILRLGMIPAEKFVSILGYLPQAAAKVKGNTPLCPGQFYRHYAPRAKLVLDGSALFQPAIAVIGFDDRDYPSESSFFSLGSSLDPEMAGQRLYEVLRRLDRENVAEAWVDMDFPKEGLWATLKERLLKAAAR